MIFAFATDDRTLMVFPDESEACAYCEGCDVEDGNWLFFDGAGEPMDAVFSTPNEHGMISVISGKYALCPSILVSKAGLKDKLAEVASVDGKPPLNSISAIKEWLIVQSGGMS